MNKWVLSTLIFLIVLTAIVLSLETSQDKIVTVKNQAFNVVDSGKIISNDLTTENFGNIKINTTSITPTKIKTNNVDIANKQIKTSSKQIETEFKTTKVKSIWPEETPSAKVQNKQITSQSTKPILNSTKIESQKITSTTPKKTNTVSQDFSEKKVTSIPQKNTSETQKLVNTAKNFDITPQKTTPKQNIIQTTQKPISSQPKTTQNEKIAMIPQRIITSNIVNTPNLNFNSPNLETNIKAYITKSVDSPEKYQIIFSFILFEDGTISSIDVSAIPLEKMGQPYPTTYSYGHLCESLELQKDQLIKNYWQGSTPKEAYLPTSQVDIGDYLVNLYNIIKPLGKNYMSDIPYEKHEERHIYISGSIYNKDVYISSDKSNY